MNNLLTYKGYKAKIEFDVRDDIFVGRLLGVPDIVSFHAETVADLHKEMEETVDFYIELCEKENKAPKKNYNGKLLFRVPSELHELIETAAASSGKSINEWGKEVFESNLKSAE